MSITFSLDGTPYTKVKIEIDGEILDDLEPEEGWIAINVSNITAGDLFRALEVPQDKRGAVGAWSVEDCSEILQKVKRQISIEGIDLTKPTTQSGRMIYLGRSPDSALSLLQRLKSLLEQAIEKNLAIVFA